MNIKQAKTITGGLSSPGKMPCHGYSLPASECNVGGRLRGVPGSTCESCYAADSIGWLRQKAAVSGKWAVSRYSTPTVVQAMAKRLASLMDPEWVEAMATLINHYERDSGYFRWHDSGDLQSREHFDKICAVCEATPSVEHWLPTREVNIVQSRPHPDNLKVRLSMPFVKQKPPRVYQLKGILTSTVSAMVGHSCPAPKQGNSCGDCRACWSGIEANIDYHYH